MQPLFGSRGKTALLALCILMEGVGCGRSDRAPSPFEEIVEAERSFSRFSATHGTRAAFLSYLAEDGIVFRPRPVNGRAWYAAAPETDAVLTWAPAAGDVSSAGDLGYTTGPWEMRDVVTETTYFGTYVSVWRKEPDGSWRVVADAGTMHPETVAPEGPVPRSSGPDDPRGGTDEGAVPADSGDDVAKAAEGFCNLGGETGADTAFARFAAPEVRLLRPEAMPVVGKDAVVKAAGSARAPVECREGGAAASGDLAYVYGTRRWVVGEEASGGDAAGAEESYLQIWRRRADGWSVVVDVAVPVVEPDSADAE